MVPIAGSAYSYSYATLGEGVAWIIGWSLILEWLFAASVVAISWSGYVSAALKDLGMALPAALSSSPLTLDAAGHIISSGTLVDLPAMLVVLGCTAICIYGLKTSSLINNVIVVAKVLALLAIIWVGLTHVNVSYWHPFVPLNQGAFGQFGWSGVASALGLA